MLPRSGIRELVGKCAEMVQVPATVVVEFGRRHRTALCASMPTADTSIIAGNIRVVGACDTEPDDQARAPTPSITTTASIGSTVSRPPRAAAAAQWRRHVD